jgi:predicted Zn-dependent protease
MDASEESLRTERSSDTMKTLRQLVAVTLISLLGLSPNALLLAADKKKNSDVEEIGNRDINKGSWNMMSIEKEIALGKQLAQDIERQVKLIDDPEIN